MTSGTPMAGTGLVFDSNKTKLGEIPYVYDFALIDLPSRYRESGQHGGTDDHYPTMTLDEIKQLPIPKLMARNSIICLWATWPLWLEDYYKEVLAAWKYRLHSKAFTWIKKNPIAGTTFKGTGRFTRANDEFAVFAIRGGGIPSRNVAISQIVEEEPGYVVESARGAHSEKPEIVSEHLWDLFRPAQMIELFARRPNRYMDTWGNQLGAAPAPAPGRRKRARGRQSRL